jgi:hypothetical protein
MAFRGTGSLSEITGVPFLPFEFYTDAPRDLAVRMKPVDSTSDPITSSNAVTLDPPNLRKVVHLHQGKEHTKARFRMLRRLPDNHDNEGAKAAISGSIDLAIAFIDTHSFSHPILATINDDGFAVLEIESVDRNVFADITFFETGSVECYLRISGAESEMHEGRPRDAATKAFFAKFGVR